jgi:hypothetical protein
MSYVIVAKGTGLIVTDGPNKTRAYKTFGAARATRTRLCNKAGWSAGDLSIVARNTYVAPKITVKNLMSGKLLKNAKYSRLNIPWSNKQP